MAMIDTATGKPTGKPAARLIVRRVPGGKYWAVFRGQEQVSGRGAQNWALGRLEELLRQGARRSRGCITCGQSFDSEGAHHRMCKACRGRSHDPMMMYVQGIG